MCLKKYNPISPANGSHEKKRLNDSVKMQESLCLGVKEQKISLAQYKSYRRQSKITKMEKQTCVYMMLFPAFGGSRDVERWGSKSFDYLIHQGNPGTFLLRCSHTHTCTHIHTHIHKHTLWYKPILCVHTPGCVCIPRPLHLNFFVYFTLCSV